ncbi:MAG: hypothetical protein H7308_06825 [Chthonomonadaceae bacterium]|nr:hypothetical protein [Chthonomonadaceae bacterium]
MNSHISSLPVEREDEENMVSNEEFFQSLVSGFESAIEEQKQRNAKLLLADAVEWIGRTPQNATETQRVALLKSQIFDLIQV